MNHDLPLALIAVWSELGAPDDFLDFPYIYASGRAGSPSKSSTYHPWSVRSTWPRW